MSLSCIGQPLWDLCECQVIIEATVSLLVIYIKIGCELVEQKHLLLNNRRCRVV